jgi:hypothetical protein
MADRPTLGKVGGVRRKKKHVRGLVKSRRKTKEDLQLESCIHRVNKLLSKLTEVETFDAFDVWCEDTIFFQFEESEKQDFVNRLLWKAVREDPVEFFKKRFTKETASSIAARQPRTVDDLAEADEARPTSFRFEAQLDAYYKIFHTEAIGFVLDMFQQFEDGLTSERYLLEEELTDGNQSCTLSNCLLELGFDTTEDPSLDEIKKAYRRKALELHPDKHPNEQMIYEERFKKLGLAYRMLLRR